MTADETLTQEECAELRIADLRGAERGTLENCVHRALATIAELREEVKDRSAVADDIMEWWGKEQKENTTLRAALAERDSLLRESKRTHTDCEDSWYSCPASLEGSTDVTYENSTECICGAAEWNAKVDAALTPTAVPRD